MKRFIFVVAQAAILNSVPNGFGFRLTKESFGSLDVAVVLG
jgi:hypothetical protein